jgi:hypothetical protein
VAEPLNNAAVAAASSTAVEVQDPEEVEAGPSKGKPSAPLLAHKEYETPFDGTSTDRLHNFHAC